MVDGDVWEVAKNTIQWFVFPLVAGLSYFVRKYIHRIDTVEIHMNNLEVRMSVVESKINDIREDTREIRLLMTKLLDKK